MALATTYSFELTVSGMIRRAFQLAGLMHASHSPSGDDLTMARDLLNLELQEMQMDSLIQRTVERTTKALVDGTREYSLDEDTIDVEIGADNVVGTYVPSSGSESRVYLMSRQEYIEQADKTTEAVPTRVFIERAATVKLIFWPIPDAASSFRYSRVKLARDTNPDSKTVDLDRRRQGALLYALAYAVGLAKVIPLDRLAELRNERDRRRAIAMRDDVERGHAQFVLSH